MNWKKSHVLGWEHSIRRDCLCNLNKNTISFCLLVLGAYISKFGKPSSGVHRTGKGLSLFQFSRRQCCTKECSNHWTIALISHVSKLMFNILQARLQH